MKFAIIAAGEGSRLAEEGISASQTPHPALRHGHDRRLVRIFAANDAEEIVIIVNRLRPETIVRPSPRRRTSRVEPSY